MSAQCSTGVFGYPYDPAGGGLKATAARIVEKARAQGRNIVENGWTIDEGGEGGLRTSLLLLAIALLLCLSLPLFA